jgi:hypothetical protein
MAALCALLWLFAAARMTPIGPTPAQAPSLQGFGAGDPDCVEWSDGCATCRREADGSAHCSTPGIACQPAAIVCTAPKP